MPRVSDEWLRTAIDACGDPELAERSYPAYHDLLDARAEIALLEERNQGLLEALDRLLATRAKQP